MYTAKDIRNICLLGHGGDGKSALAESMLFLTKAIDRLGKRTDGNTTSDFDPEEIKRGYSISTAVLPVEYNKCKLNILDNPGYFAFSGEVAQSLRVADAGLICLTAKGGIAVGTEKGWDALAGAGLPAMFYISKLDEEHADFFQVYDALHDTYGQGVVPLTFPIVSGEKVLGLVDVVSGTATKPDGGKMELPGDAADHLELYQHALNEAVAETSEELMEKFFEEGELSREEIISGLNNGILGGDITPVCCCAAQPNIGVCTLMDNLVKYMPPASMAKAPKAVNPKTGDAVEVKQDGKFAAQVIKTVIDQFGKYSILKVYSGVLSADVAPYNTREEKSEKPSAPGIMRGKKVTPIDKLIAGDIGVLSKLQYTATGDTLCDASAPVQFEAIKFPEPCIKLAVSAKKQGEEDKVFAGLNKLLEEDPTMALEKNAETGDMLLCGLGEVHIDVLCAKLKNKTGVEAQISDPRIPYRETIRGTAEAEGKHKKQTGGSGQFGVVNMRFEPLTNGEDFEFVNAIVGGVVPKEYIPAVEKGTREAMKHGVLAGYPMIGVKATLFFGKYHPVDSKEVAFKSAARLAYKEACAKAQPALIEPIYQYNITVPNEYTGAIMGDLSSRRGRVLGMNPCEEGTEVVAEAPLSEMFKYATDLRSMTQARGSFTSQFVRYEDVPAFEAKKIIENAQKEEDEEE